jgi:DNA gyrase subunit A
MAGVSISEGKAIYFGPVVESGHLITAANSSQALAKSDGGSVKLTPMKAYPKQGRASKGVRCHKFLKSEDQLYFAKFVGSEPVVFDEAGKEIASLEVDAKRDGTGKKIKTYVTGAN